jgi:hypothetical protein
LTETALAAVIVEINAANAVVWIDYRAAKEYACEKSLKQLEF